MPVCGGCGREVSPEWRVCPHCSYPVGAPAGCAAAQQPRPEKPDTASLVGAVIIALAVSVPYSLGVIALAESLRGIEIDDWTCWRNSQGDVIFSVNVTNYGDEVRDATIVCVVVFEPDGAEFSYSRDVTLGPGETRNVRVYVSVSESYKPSNDFRVGCHLE